MKNILFFTLVLFVSTLLGQEQEFQAIEGFRFKLPETWVEIPNDVLKEYADMIQKASRQTQKEVYNYGYQLKENEEWLTHPYILIQVKNQGRIPESSLKNLKTIQAGMEEGLSEAENSFGEIVSRTSVEQPVYDKTNHLLFATLTVNVNEVGIVKGLIAIKLTEKGTINFYGYALKEEFEEYLVLYKKAILQMQVDDVSLAYKPRVTDSLPSFLVNMNWYKILLYTVIGALIGVISSKKKKKTNEDINKSEPGFTELNHPS